MRRVFWCWLQSNNSTNLDLYLTDKIDSFDLESYSVKDCGTNNDYIYTVESIEAIKATLVLVERIQSIGEETDPICLWLLFVVG